MDIYYTYQHPVIATLADIPTVIQDNSQR